ncbi:MAG: hypothetical protein ACE5MB_09255 [Anaerolineae bacterium]
MKKRIRSEGKIILTIIAISLAVGLTGYTPGGKPSLDTTASPPMTLQPTPTPSTAVTFDGVIEGQVVNGTAGATADSVAQLEITLHPFIDDAPQETITTTTDAQGRFRFRGQARGSDRTYAVSAHYQGVDYFSGLLAFAEGETIIPAMVTIYETTEDDGAIRVERIHLIIDFFDKTMRVGEMFIFRNDGDRTYVGSERAHGEGRRTLRFSLPPGATGLRFDDPRMGASVIPTEEGFFDTLPVLPGMRQILLSYDLPYDSTTYRFAKTLEYSTTSLNILVADVGVQVSTDQLIPREPREVSGGARYLHFAGQNLARGAELVIQFSNLPQRVSGEEVTPPLGGQETLKWVGLGLAVLAAAFALGYPLLRRRWAVEEVEEPLEREKEELLLALARLDDAFEAGEIPEVDYQRQRGEIKARLIEVMRALRGGEQ